MMMTHEIFRGLGLLYLVGVIAMLLVIAAMAVDLLSGWRKAKMLGEAHSSYLFSRTFNKFLVYEGILIICCFIDTLVHFALYLFVDWNYNVPMVTSVLAIILCATEAWSVYEKAEDKARRRMAVVATTAATAAARLADREAVLEAVREVMAERSGEGAGCKATKETKVTEAAEKDGIAPP